jgi:hypothetical protein
VIANIIKTSEIANKNSEKLYLAVPSMRQSLRILILME